MPDAASSRQTRETCLPPGLFRQPGCTCPAKPSKVWLAPREGIWGFRIDLFIIITGVLFALRLGVQRHRCIGDMRFWDIAHDVIVRHEPVLLIASLLLLAIDIFGLSQLV